MAMNRRKNIRRTPMRRKSIPYTRRKRLRAETEEIAKAFFLGLPCIICGSTFRTCGHHIIPRSLSAWLMWRVENIVPVWPAHHQMGQDLAAEKTTLMAAHRFSLWMQENMPKRFAWVEEHDQLRRQHSGEKLSIDDIETDHAFWTAIRDNGRDYRFVCETCDVEAYGLKAILAGLEKEAPHV